MTAATENKANDASPAVVDLKPLVALMERQTTQNQQLIDALASQRAGGAPSEAISDAEGRAIRKAESDEARAKQLSRGATYVQSCGITNGMPWEEQKRRLLANDAGAEA